MLVREYFLLLFLYSGGLSQVVSKLVETEEGAGKLVQNDKGAGWLVSIELKNRRICAGVQVSKEWFLTLSRCVKKGGYDQYTAVLSNGETRNISSEKRNKALVLLKTGTGSNADGKFAMLASKKIPQKFEGSFRFYSWNKRNKIRANSVDITSTADCVKQCVDGKYDRNEHLCISVAKCSRCSLTPGLPLFGHSGKTWLLVGLQTTKADVCKGSYRKAVKISKYRNWINQSLMISDF